MKNIVVFASGSGSNFQSILDAVQSGRLNARVAALITDRGDIGSIDRAQRAGIPVHILNPVSFKSKDAYSEALLSTLQELRTDLIVLAGYLRLVPATVIQAYEGVILNIHPSLLPRYGGKGYYGSRVHKAVIDAGDPVSGCTIHVVTEEYDEGPVIAQAEVQVLPDDTPETLAARILKEEHRLYPETINTYLQKLN